MFTLQNDKLNVVINPLGAQLWSIQDKSGKEYLWQGDPKYWKGKGPNLFPYIGRFYGGKYTLDGKDYEMNIHGFCRTTDFDMVEQSAGKLVMRIEDTEETFAQYPYHFRFDTTYELVDNQIKLTFTVENKDDKTMYFAVGGHPGFNVPMEEGLEFTDYELVFGDCEPVAIGFSADHFVDGTVAPFALGEGGVLKLQHNLFDNDAIVLTKDTKQVTLCSKKGTRAVKVTYPDMEYCGFWHAPETDAPYVCIEPWSALPSRQGIVEDLATKPDMTALEPGKVYQNTWVIEII